MRISFLIIILISRLAAAGQVSVDAGFENGFADLISIKGDTVSIAPDASTHFRITNALDKKIVFHSGTEPSELFHNSHRMVFRCEADEEWRFMDTGFVAASGAYYCYNHAPFRSDTVWIAYWYPYSYGDMSGYFRSLKGHPHISHAGEAGISLNGRKIYTYTMAAPGPGYKRKHIVITGRQHAGEPISSYVVKGFTDYLLESGDEEAEWLRQNAFVHVYPMVNPDGVASGGNSDGQPDHNDAWLRGWPAAGGAHSGNFETDQLRNHIAAATDGKVDYAFDIHALPGHSGKYFWWGPSSGSDTAGVLQAMDLVQAVSSVDGADHSGHPVIEGTIRYDTRELPGPWADHWFDETLGAVSFTLEAGSAPSVLTTGRIEALGASIAKGLGRVLSGCETNDGRILLSNSQTTEDLQMSGKKGKDR